MTYIFGLPFHLVLVPLVPGLLFWVSWKSKRFAIKVASSSIAAIMAVPILLIILWASFSLPIYQDIEFDGKRYVSIKYESTLSRSKHYLEHRMGVWPVEIAFRKATTYEEPIYLNVEDDELVARLIRPNSGAVVMRIGG